MSAGAPRSFHVPVLGSSMRVVDTGVGDPVVFLHGNPTSSYLWRGVIPAVAAAGYRCVAVDLIGMGDSGKPDIGYRFTDHAAFLDATLDVLVTQCELELPAVLVGHDWGAVLALNHASNNPDEVRAVAVCEAHLRPIERWDDMGEDAELFKSLRAPGSGEAMVLEENFFVEQVLPGGTRRTLTAEEVAAYGAPFATPDSRRPVLAWVREIPIEGVPAEMVSTVTTNQEVLADPGIPVLVMHGQPGAILGEEAIAWCREIGRSLSIADVGPGLHFLPEDRPQQVAKALVTWLQETPGSG